LKPFLFFGRVIETYNFEIKLIQRAYYNFVLLQCFLIYYCKLRIYIFFPTILSLLFLFIKAKY
jgi:hypothetical protein